MASKQRSRPAKKERASNPLVDLVIFDVPNVDMMDMDVDNASDVDESALESELEALLSGKAPTKPVKPKQKIVPALDIEKMAAECMKDPDVDDDDESLLNDPELMKELLENLSDNEEKNEEIAVSEEKQNTEESGESKTPDNMVLVIEQRLEMYNNALAAAKAVGDNFSKVRRFSRAQKTLESLLKSARLGIPINKEDIPPEVSIPKADNTEPAKISEPSAPCIIPDSAAEKPTEIENILSDVKGPVESDDNKLLMTRRDEYRVAALHAKKAGNKATALEYMKISKSIDAVIEEIKSGHILDLSNIPPVPNYRVSIGDTSSPLKGEQDEIQTYSSIEAAALSAAAGVSIGDTSSLKGEQDEIQTYSSIEAAALSAAAGPEDPTMFAAPPPPTSVLEALQQRLEKYASTKAAAEAEGNSSKARRLQRIIKSYEKAIKDFTAGRPVDFAELATPPGFAPIPVPSQSNETPQYLPDKNSKPAEESKPDSSPKGSAPQIPSDPLQTAQGTAPKPKVTRTNTSTFNKQLEFLMERQKLFRQAALASKKSGDLQQAKEYLRMSKGFASMIEATRCGLPIDISKIPTPPQLQTTDFIIVDAFECVPLPGMDENSANVIETLENDLIKQIEVCARKKEYFLRLGDVLSVSKFEKLGLESKKDLSVISHIKNIGGSAPRFHYETRLFSIIQCHTDLKDNELEVTVERGINLQGRAERDDLDSYIRIEFPIPSDAPQKAKTRIKDTSNPIFQEEFKFEINRKSRAQLRQFKRQSLKLEVYSKSGFLRSDSHIGTAYVKLVDLESKCTIHDCFDLMDGRKSCGGKLEVKIRVRDPLLVKQVEEVKEKWLVIGS